ncbi:MAG: aspartyl protease family protein [Chitinophagaceae bacterium]|nr:aspartyl protease family protein [Chitinophagaceae bacterium]
MKKELVLYGFLLFCFCNQSQAQEEFVQPPAKFLTKFNFVQLTGGVIVLKAKVDNCADSLNFVLDTGSGGISLDSLTVVELGFKISKSERTIRGIAGMKKVDFAYDHTLHLKGLDVPHLDFHINDYDLLTSVYGVRIDGVIGYSFLRRFIVKVDYDDMEIQVFTPGSYKYPRGGYMLSPDFSNLPLQAAMISDGHPIHNRYIFDTGAGLCFLLSKDFVEDSSVLKSGRKVYPTQAEGLGGKKTMNLTVVKEVKLGPYKFRKVPVHIFNDEFNVTSYPLLGGIIGNDLLRRFNLIINYPEQKIFIKPNTHIGDAFDYSYTGLGIYQIDGEIKVIDVMENSPGDIAGFKSGDVIFSLENNYSKNIQTYKNLFQNATGRIKVVIFRHKEPMILTIDVKDIRRK